MATTMFTGEGEARATARTVDWSATAVGPPETWPVSLRTALGIVFHSRHPMFLWWGPELIQFYNDAYLPSFGLGKHPAAMGQRGADCWQEIWPIIYPQIEDVLLRGRASWNQDQLVPIFRNGRIEEVYWTYGYSPVFDEAGAIAGVLVVCTETTAGVLAMRRLDFVRQLATALHGAQNSLDIARLAASNLEGAPLDVPFGVVAMEGVEPFCFGLEGPVPALGAPLPGSSFASRKLVQGVRCAAWEESVTDAVVHTFEGAPGGTLTLGLSPRLPFDRDYESFLRQIVDQIVGAQGRVAIELERQIASRAKDEFLAMLGHELRNPLAPILTAVEIMKARNVPEVEHEREIIDRQAHHLVHLVDDLLDVSRVVAGKVELKKRRVQLSTVVASALETASPLFEKKGHVLRVVVPEAGLALDADPMRLSQIVANLLTNAARYTDPGGVISVTASSHQRDVVLRVQDNGMGIPAEQLPHLFERFFQGPRAADRAQGGLGLGLALVKSLVELHGGSVRVESGGAGHGSAFEVRLGLAQGTAPEEPRDAVDRSTPFAAQAERVLLIDDSEDITDVFGTLLQLNGFDVQTAHDGPSALRQAELYDPTVVVLDLGLPVMDGYEIASKLLERAAGRPLRLIAMSGYGLRDDLERTTRAGFEQHLVKPVDATALLRAIARR